ncbi:MAG: diguanylate cyclase, partial [Sphingomicrobium sp.]
MTLRQFAERLQQRSVEDAKLVAGVVATIVAAVLAHRLNLFDRFYDISRAHEDLQLDEIVPMALVVLLSVAWLRARQLRNEVARRETAEQQAHALARHDPLTGLANRRVLAEYLDSAQQRLADTQRELAVLVVDLDRFKPVNDLHGHAGGDLVLRQVSTRLAEVLHAAPGSLLARLGGDEFACVIDYAPHSDAPLRIAKQIVSRIAEPFLVDGSNVQIGASVGIALCTDGATDPDQLLRAADIAMYGAKRDGRSTFRSYEPSMDAELRLRGALEDELRQGLARGEVIPFYQPITRLPSGQLVGFEALARSANPLRGEISPEVFIPIAEDAGLIDQITTAILSRACIDARDWPPHLSLSINISPIQLKNRWLSARLLQIITEGG